MITEVMKEVGKYVLAGGVGAALVEVFHHWSSRSVERLRAELERLNTETREKLTADLERANREHELRFGPLYLKRAEVLAELHGLLLDTIDALSDIPMEAQFGISKLLGQEPGTVERTAHEATTALEDKFHRAQLYLDGPLAARVEWLVQRLRNTPFEYARGRADLVQKVPGARTGPELVTWMAENQAALARLVANIENDFRRVLGVEPKRDDALIELAAKEHQAREGVSCEDVVKQP